MEGVALHKFGRRDGARPRDKGSIRLKWMSTNVRDMFVAGVATVALIFNIPNSFVLQIGSI